jgi:hypothetical protein
MENEIKKRPIKTLTCGFVQLSIWADSKVMNHEVVEVHSIRIDRAYKQGQTWAHTNTLNVEDLPKVAVLAHEAYKSLRVRTLEPAAQPDTPEDDPDCEGRDSRPAGERK